MEYKEYLEYINSNAYMDAGIKSLNINYFGDEVILVHEYDGNRDIRLFFHKCYKVAISNDLKLEKQCPMKDLPYSQIPYYIQDIVLEKVSKEKLALYKIFLDANLLEMEIICMEIDVQLINKIETLDLKCSDFAVITYAKQ